MGFMDSIRAALGNTHDQHPSGIADAPSTARHINYDAPVVSLADAGTFPGGKHALRD